DHGYPMRRILLTALLVLVPAAAVLAQESGSRKPATTAPQAAPEPGRVAVPPPSELALRYYRTSNLFWGINKLWGLAIPCLFLWIPYLLVARSPRRWWLYTGLLTVPFLFLSLLVMPIWIDPLFNRFGELQDKALEARILALANRAGIRAERVYEVNKSVDTKE